MAKGKSIDKAGRDARSGRFLKPGRTRAGTTIGWAGTAKGATGFGRAPLADEARILERAVDEISASVGQSLKGAIEDVARARHVKASPGWAWPAEIAIFDDGEHVITCAAWPGLVAGGATLAEALEDARGALEELALGALAHGEPWPPAARPTGGDQVLLALTPYAAMRGLLTRWAAAYGRGAQTELARLLEKDRKHAARLLDPDTPVQSDSLAEAVTAIGVTPVTSFALARPAGHELSAKADLAAAAALDDLGGL
ncbi:type II toxin-antitoxin system HicB family antitoxin [Hyphobacterium sp.]|uniref:type II toxin-antitoxin system HicB family antitoxin n=1 Tax=Hyphobacterium sp. TaxID=2004662 RepID=UPI003B529771